MTETEALRALGMSLLVKKQGFIPGSGIALGVCSNNVWIPTL